MRGLLYDVFIEDIGAVDRPAQRKAVDLLVDLSDGEVDQYSIAAPTGTGKSYAALLAGVHNARMERRTVVGTSTLVLSDQYSRDMSLVSASFPDVKFFVLKGATHYYCGNKAGEEMRNAKTEKRKEWLRTSARGMIHGSSKTVPSWCAADPEYCSNCIENYRRKHETTCDYARARQEALHADVVVTTHAMIAADLRVRLASQDERNVLGDVWLTVFDEAHKAYSSLVYDDVFTAKMFDNLNFEGCLNMLTYDRRSEIREFFENPGVEHEWYRATAETGQRISLVWPTSYEVSQMRRIAYKHSSDKEKQKLVRTVSFLDRARMIIDQIAAGDNAGDDALWYRDGKYFIREMLPETKIVEKLATGRVAWMSATIGSASRPNYSTVKCGIDSKHFELESSFDYEKQLSYFIRSEAGEVEADLLTQVNQWWPGGMVVLTSTHRRKEAIASKLRMTMPHERVADQISSSGNAATLNTESVKLHVDSALSNNRPVLIGVDVFSTGVDLPGNALSKLVIAGLFPLREDFAYIAWRCRWLEKFGGNGFEDFLLPERAIVLEQQVGRVIRRETDVGTVLFYVENKDAKNGSDGARVIEEALRAFPGVKELI